MQEKCKSHIVREMQLLTCLVYDTGNELRRGVKDILCYPALSAIAPCISVLTDRSVHVGTLHGRAPLVKLCVCVCVCAW